MSILLKVLGAILLGLGGLNDDGIVSGPGPVRYGGQNYGRLGQSSQQRYSAEDYYVSVNPTTWAKADEDCEAHFNGNGQLLSLETEEELKWIAEKWLSRSDTSGTNFWTSGSYVSQAPHWRWINGKAFAPFARNKLVAPQNPNAKHHTLLQFQSAFEYNLSAQQNTQINRYICERVRTNIPIPCYEDNDLCILVDASGSVTEPHFRQALDWASQIAEAWTKNRGNRVSFKIFNQGVVSIIPLVNSLSPSQIKSTILQTRYISGGTRTDLALDEARAELMVNRRGVPQNIVCLTDGESNDKPKTVVAANNVKAAGIRGFAVGIGAQVSLPELRTIAGDNQKRVYTSSSFDELIHTLTPVTYDVCNQYSP